MAGVVRASVLMVVATVLAPLVATFVVSILPIGVLFLLPTVFPTHGRRSGAHDQHVSVSGPALNMMLCFAAGSLIGDALLHLLLHGIFGDFPSVEVARKQALAAILGIVFFFAMDTSVRLASSKGRGGDADGDGDADADAYADPLGLPGTQKPTLLAPVGGAARRRARHAPAASPSTAPASACPSAVPASTSRSLPMISTGRATHSPERSHHSHHHNCGGLLSLVADAIHNFTDGLALAAAFATDLRLGATTTVAIFLHEIPHEIGDYAILIKSGYRHQRVILLQLGTAMAAFAGTIFGIAIHRGLVPGIGLVDEHAVLPFAAGGFLYIAMCTILPEVLSDQHTPRTLGSCLGQLAALVVGVALMAALD